LKKVEKMQSKKEPYASHAPSAIVQAMSFVEDFTPIKPVVGDINGFEDAMFKGSLLGLPHEISWAIVFAGCAYGALVLLL